jgi:hypothetical protein
MHRENFTESRKEEEEPGENPASEWNSSEFKCWLYQLPAAWQWEKFTIHVSPILWVLVSSLFYFQSC